MRKQHIAAILATISLAFAVTVFILALNADANIRAANNAMVVHDKTFTYSH